MHTVLQSLATGNPPLRMSQKNVADNVQKIESLPAAIRRRIPQIYQKSGVDYRYTCVEDYGREPSQFDFFPDNWRLEPSPPTSKRNRRYRDNIIPLVDRVARQALSRANLKPADITHLITVSCTGFFAPGFDIHLIKRLGMRADTGRTMIGFMGCYAALTGLRMAHALCQSRPDARVLLVCAELCTLHFQIKESLQSAVVNALFADGVAAAVLASQTSAQGKLTYADGHSLLDGDSLDYMTWDVGDTGFDMGLSSRVPQVIARCLPGYIETLLGRNELRPEQIDFWAIHPGGRNIVEKAQQVLNLQDSDVHDSFEVLRLYGNMSSPTILFILEKILDRNGNGVTAGQDCRTGVALAFGPGLTIEGCLFKRL